MLLTIRVRGISVEIVARMNNCFVSKAAIGERLALCNIII